MALGTGWISIAYIVAREAGFAERLGFHLVSTAVNLVGIAGSKLVRSLYHHFMACGTRFTSLMTRHAVGSECTLREMIESPRRRMRVAEQVDALMTFIAG